MKTPAFKEWSVIVEALGAGRQAIVLRKGGIHEGRRGFQPEHDQFWLFPTGFHQHADKVEPTIAELETPVPEDVHPIGYWAEAVATYKLTDYAKVAALRPYHHWKDSVIEERFHMGKWTGLYCLVLRVSRACESQNIPTEPGFGGCRSWLNLPLAEPLSEDRQPVLGVQAFEAIREQVAALLEA